MEIFVLLMSPTPAKVLGSALPLSPIHVVTGLEGYGQSAAGQSLFPLFPRKRRKSFPLNSGSFSSVSKWDYTKILPFFLKKNSDFFPRPKVWLFFPCSFMRAASAGQRYDLRLENFILFSSQSFLEAFPFGFLMLPRHENTVYLLY